MTSQTAEREIRVHATTVAVGEAGVLIRGASGSGKSALALALIGLSAQTGRFTRLVADDRTAIHRCGNRLVARPVPPLEGLIERRGLGLTPEPHLDAAVLRLVVDIVEAPDRMPEPEVLVERILEVGLPRIFVTGGDGSARLALAALALFSDAA